MAVGLGVGVGVVLFLRIIWNKGWVSNGVGSIGFSLFLLMKLWVKGSSYRHR